MGFHSPAFSVRWPRPLKLGTKVSVLGAAFSRVFRRAFAGVDPPKRSESEFFVAIFLSGALGCSQHFQFFLHFLRTSGSLGSHSPAFSSRWPRPQELGGQRYANLPRHSAACSSARLRGSTGLSGRRLHSFWLPRTAQARRPGRCAPLAGPPSNSKL